MKFIFGIVLFSTVCNIYSTGYDLSCTDEEQCDVTPHVVLKLHKRDDELARKIGNEHGMEVRGPPFMDRNYFLYHTDNTRSRRHKRAIHERLEAHPAVELLSEQTLLRRSKRDFMDDASNPAASSTSSLLSDASENVNIPHLPFKDPLYKDQWYLNGNAVGGWDMNVRPVWLMGYTGKNVSISILDDGIQRDHVDLVANYDPLASTDINDHDDDPIPRDNGDNKHGTRCAGEVASVADNDECGVGIAFKSNIGGVRMLDGPGSDGVEAAGLSFNQDHIDIYSASWGPLDDGVSFERPGPLASEAFYRGIKTGRSGKGSIFVWASGNGGLRYDSCAADGYTSSIYTLSISSATFDNRPPWYLEECPSVMATTYSSANIDQVKYKISTVDVPRGCTNSHTGTSASAPLAAGILALVLEANPSLTWRDIQHLVLRTANTKPLMNNTGWTTNGAGRLVSSKFGFGLIDGEALVKTSKTWKTVPEQHICSYDYKLSAPNPRPVSGQFQLNFTLEVDGCESGTPVLYLEYVQVQATVRYSKRGDLKMTLLSPAGTRSVILPPRTLDNNTQGFYKFPLSSVQQWGEDPRGTWTLTIESVSTNSSLEGSIHDWSLVLYGTAEPAQPGDVTHPSSSSSIQKTADDSKNEVTLQQSNASLNLTSVGDCHEQCKGGCSEPRSATACFSCKTLTQTLRNRGGEGFKCVSRCESTFYRDGDKCKLCSSRCRTCTSSEHCLTCSGLELLIDVNGKHPLPGQCVEKCPEETVADYETNLVQARCVLKRDRCGPGYYIAYTGKCAACDVACGNCHGPGATNCDSCSKGFGNFSNTYCKPCCTEGENDSIGQCDKCISELKHSGKTTENSSFFSLLWIILVGGVIILLLVVIGLFWQNRKTIGYTSLKDIQEDRAGLLDKEDETDSEDENLTSFPRPHV